MVNESSQVPEAQPNFKRVDWDALFRRYAERSRGETVRKLCQEAGVSHTLFYRKLARKKRRDAVANKKSPAPTTGPDSSIEPSDSDAIASVLPSDGSLTSNLGEKVDVRTGP